MFAKTLRFRPWVLLLALLVVVVASGWASACPTCKDSLVHSDPEAANLVRGYFWSICFMMSMPFVIFFSVGAYFYWSIVQARRAQQPTATAPAGWEAATS